MDRAGALRALGASEPVVAELLPRTGPLFPEPPPDVWPPLDEPHLSDWERYAAAGGGDEILAALRKGLLQLHFPVREGVSTTDAYRRAVRRGELPGAPAAPPPLELERPGDLELRLFPTLAGRIPALVTSHRADFETLVRVFSARNEPVPVPASMGACLVRNLTNWERLRAYRATWESEQGFVFPGAWERELARLRDEAERSRYQDRFLILSHGPYSGVPASEAGCPGPEWPRLSLRIREEHEGAHYLALRAGAELRDAPADELLADWLGMVRALGHYPPGLARRALGLEEGGRYREGGRLENYLGGELSPEALAVLCRLLDRAVARLASLSPPADERQLARLFLDLSSRSLEELATTGISSPSAVPR